MSQLIYTNLIDGQVPLAAGFNTRFLLAINLINSGLEEDNLATNSVTSAKIFAGAVTTTKLSHPVLFVKSSDIASATTTDLATATGNCVDITGTTTITAFGTLQAGTVMFLTFTGALTLTHNATSLILPTASNITTVAGDTSIFLSLGSGNWRCLDYQTSLIGTVATQANMETATSTTTYVTPGRTQYHPGVAKAWAQWTGATTGTNAPNAGYNVTSITRNSTGDYTVTITNAFSSGVYAIVACGIAASAGNAICVSVKNGTTPSTTSFNLICYNTGGSNQDPTSVYVACYGDQ